MLELPGPKVAGWVDKNEVDAAIAYAKPDEEGRAWYGNPYDGVEQIPEVFLQAFSHLGTDYAIALGLPIEEAPRLEQVGVKVTTALPGKPIIASAASWHTDAVPSITIATKPPTEYLAGQLDFSKVPDELYSSYIKGGNNALGQCLSNYDFNTYTLAGLSVVQTLPYTPYILTEEYFHRSPLNLSEVPVSRALIDIIFKV